MKPRPFSTLLWQCEIYQGGSHMSAYLAPCTYLSCCKGLGVPGMWAGSEGCGGLPLL